MFEKETKEWANKMDPSDGQAQRYLLMGAEFGYNKANEWHYIKDGNLPKENENVLIYSNRANHIGFYRNGFWFTNSDGCLEDDDIEVIAWKEIVLPKESE
jgi:hypothetical protein